MSTPDIASRLRRAYHALRVQLSRPRWAIVELHVATPVYPSASDPSDVAAHFRNVSTLAGRRATAISALAAAGWEMDHPTVRLDDPARLTAELRRDMERQGTARVINRLRCDGFLDVDLRFRKRYRAAENAERDLVALALDDGTDNWDFGWDERPDGDVAWWCALHDFDYRDC